MRYADDRDLGNVRMQRITDQYRHARELVAGAQQRDLRSGLIITLIVFVGLAAIIVWIADWTSGGERRSTALDTLNQRLARGEIDRAEYEEKRKLIGR